LVRPGDTLARFSGDEFVFLCEDLHGAGDVEVLAQRIDQSFTEPFVLARATLTVTASVGMAFAGPGEDISNRLVVKADMAMYQAKRRGRTDHQIVDLREVRDGYDDTTLERDLRTAFTQDALDIAYQPIVRTTDGQVVGVEALLRWTHPDQGSIPALSIVSLAEQSDLITDIGAWVLERSCLDRGRWLRQYPDSPLDLAVNVSASQLLSPGFCGFVLSALARTGMDPEALVLEITESILIEDTESTMTVLTALRDSGIRLALDDFGTGYSALSYLRRMPIDMVKIDQSFVADIDDAATGGAIVAAVTNLAHVLGLSVTAEGVESQSQRDEVRSIGCELAQGFFYSPPLPAAAIGTYLKEASPGPVQRAHARTRRQSRETRPLHRRP
jgi:EAL domain-containing protein (putative c-di-GMP-specific phosphodiesterase class I)